MRIAFILPQLTLNGGIKVVAIYARWLTRFGHDVTLVSVPPRVPPPRRRLSMLIHERRWWRASTGFPFPLDPDVRHVVLDKFRPISNADVPAGDAVIATWWETAEWVNALDQYKGAKVYFVQHHEVFDYLPVERCKATYGLPLKKIVVARWLSDLMREHYGDADVDIVPNAVDHEQFTSPPRGKQRQPTVGFLYSSTPFKGVDLTMKAIDRLRAQFPKLRVRSFGVGSIPADLVVGNTLEFESAPAQGRLKDIYGACDVWMTASRSEGFNLPAMEAMACRTPVVSTKTGWPAEAITTGRNGALVDVDDVEGLASATARILSLPEVDWRRMSDAAFETVASASWERSARMFEACLLKAVATRPGVTPGPSASTEPRLASGSSAGDGVSRG